MYYKKKRIYKKRKTYYKKKNQNAYGLAKLALSRLNGEQKIIDTKGTPSPGTGGLFYLLNGSTKGDDVNQRNGQRIRLRSMFINITTNINSLSTTDVLIRYIIFIDKQPNAAAPVLADVLEDTTYVIQSPMEIDNSKRFIVLANQKCAMSINGVRKMHKSIYKKLNYIVQYNSSNAGTIADITTNSLYLLILSDDNTNSPSFDFYCRLRYVDN